MKNADFTCPKCGSHKLVEVMVDVTVGSNIRDITIENGEASFSYGEQTNEDGSVNSYQCENCGYVLTINGDTVNDLKGLARWFEENGQIVE